MKQKGSHAKVKLKKNPVKWTNHRSKHKAVYCLSYSKQLLNFNSEKLDRSKYQMQKERIIAEMKSRRIL